MENSGSYSSESSQMNYPSQFTVLFSGSAMDRPRMPAVNLSAVICSGISSSIKAAAPGKQ